MANKRFTANEYDATIQSSTIIEAIPDLDNTIGEPVISYHFKFLSQIAELPEKTRVDVIGVINSVSEPVEFTSKKSNKEMTRREVTLVDKSMAECRLTFWNEEAVNFAGQVGNVIALKSVTINDFQGKSLSINRESTVSIDPDLPETHELRTWWNAGAQGSDFKRLNAPIGGGGASSAGYNSNTYISQINSAQLVQNEKPRYFSFVGMVSSTNSSNRHIYKACKNCNKKLQDNNDGGTLNCPKCHSATTEHSYRMMITLNVTDATGDLWVTLFQDAASKLLGKSVDELAELYNTCEEHYNELLNNLRFKTFSFRVGARLEEYNNEYRIRCNGYTVVPMTPADEHSKLIHFIDVLKNQLAA